MSIAVFGPMLMLRACALESVFKAMYVALARLAGLADASAVTALLTKLQRYITAGRYPIETSAQRTFPDDASGYAWTDGDEAEFDRLRMALFEQDVRLSRE